MTRMRPTRSRHDGSDLGFSFVELLAYIAIAALLILAAIPQFSNFRGQAIDQTTRSDVYNVAAAYEAWAIEHPGERFPEAYRDFEGTSKNVQLLKDMGVVLSPGTRLVAIDRDSYRTPASTVFTAPGQAFCVYAYNTSGKTFKAPRPVRFNYHSGAGGMGVVCSAL